MTSDINNDALRCYARATTYFSEGDYSLARVYLQHAEEKCPDIKSKDFFISFAEELATRMLNNG